MSNHLDLIVDQFTRQALPFSTAPLMNDEESLQLLIEAAQAAPEDLMLDVACGPGIVACAFARNVQHVVGTDLTPAMLARARRVAEDQQLQNVSFNIGEVNCLPFASQTFSLVTSRFAFHHLQDPLSALREMKRVCRTGGRILLADMAVSEDPIKAAKFNRSEKLRDPSHARGLPLSELLSLFDQAGLRERQVTPYKLDVEVEAQLRRSFPEPGDDEKIRRMFRESVSNDSMGASSRIVDGKIWFSYSIAAIVAVNN